MEVGTVRIGPSATMLKEANVEAEKQLIETRIDKLVYNADKDITSKGGNATDILRKVPMLSVDRTAMFHCRETQNVRILINNKPSSLMSANTDALKMIPADEIEKVKSSPVRRRSTMRKVPAASSNIITKKKNIEGLSGSINAGAGTRSSKPVRQPELPQRSFWDRYQRRRLLAGSASAMCPPPGSPNTPL